MKLERLEKQKYETEEGRCIYAATSGSNVLCSLAVPDLSNRVPCSHEEADTRLFLHVADAVQKGLQESLCAYRRY